MTTTQEYRIAAIDFERDFRLMTWLLLALLAAAMVPAVRAIRAANLPAVSSEASLAATPTVASFGPIVSHNGRVVGEVVSYPNIIAAGNEVQWIVRLSTAKGESVSDAGLLVDAYMPESAVRAAPRPIARYLGDGRYSIDGVRFSRAGWWNVALSVQRASGTDSLAFNLLVPRQPR